MSTTASDSDVLSFRDTVDVIKDFLEVAINMILYIREVYPQAMFEAKQKYSVGVYQSRNPHLNEYIGRLTQAIGQELLKGTLKKVALIIKTSNERQTPLERFVFDVEWLISDKMFAKHGADYKPSKDGCPKDNVSDHLRAFLLKLSTADSYLLSNPKGEFDFSVSADRLCTHTQATKDITFAVVIELREGAERPDSDAVSKGQEEIGWVPADKRDAPSGSIPDSDMDEDSSPERSYNDPSNRDKATIAPLKSVRLGMVNIQLVVEEMGAKFPDEVVDVLAEEEAQARKDRKGKARAR